MAATMAPTVDGAGLQGTGSPLLNALSPSDIHVLLVDDERLTRLVVGNLLRTCKYKVTIAESGTQALEVLSKAGPGAFHLILTDVMMPDVGGLELLRFVRNHQHLYNVPVIMMSASEEQETMCAALLGSADEYLVKPVTRKEVQNIWMHVMKRYHSAASAPPAVVPEAAQDPAAAPAAGVTPSAAAAAGACPAGGDLAAVGIGMGAGPGGGRAALLSLGMGPGLGLSPQVARDLMRAAALAASTTAAVGAHAATGAPTGAHPEAKPSPAGVAPAALQHPGTHLGAPGPVSGGLQAGGGAAANSGGRGGTGTGAAGGSGASKVNLLKWLRRPTRCVQPKESFRIFCEVLLLLDSVHAACGARPCGLRPSKLVLHSNGRVAFGPRPGASSAAAGAGAGAARGRSGSHGGADATGNKKRRRGPHGEPCGDEGCQEGSAGAAAGAGEARGAEGPAGGGLPPPPPRQPEQLAARKQELADGPACSQPGRESGTPAAHQLSQAGFTSQHHHHTHPQCQQPGQEARLDSEGGRRGVSGKAPLSGNRQVVGAGAVTAEAAACAPVAATAAAVVAPGVGPAVGLGFGVACSGDEDEDALYRSPEEEQGQAATHSSDMFSLGLLFFELFYSCAGQDRAALLRDARQRLLPASFGRQQPKEAAFALALLHPEPASRPTLEELLGSAMFRATCASLRQRGGGAGAGAGGAQQQQQRLGDAGAAAATTGGGPVLPPCSGQPQLHPVLHPPGQLAQSGAGGAAGRRAPGGEAVSHGCGGAAHLRPHQGGPASRSSTAGAKGAARPAPHRLAHGSSGGASPGMGAVAAGAHAAVACSGAQARGQDRVGQGGGPVLRAGAAGPPAPLSPSSSGGVPGAGGGLRVDDAVLLEFLKLLRKRKLEELVQIDSELGSLTSDAQAVEQYLQYLLQTRTAKRQRGGAPGPGHVANTSAPSQQQQQQQQQLASHEHPTGPPESGEAVVTAAAATSAVASPGAGAAAAPPAVLPAGAPSRCPAPSSAAWSEQHQAAQSKWCRIAHKYELLEPVFRERRRPGPPSPTRGPEKTQPPDAATADGTGAAQRRRRHADAGGLPDPLLRFAEDLASFATYTTLTPVASLRYGDPPTSTSMVAGVAFDRDDEFFAVAGVSKRIKIFEREAVLQSNVGAHYPVLEISSRSRLSSVTWSGYIKGHLASADYEGVVQLWDANTNTELMQFEEHRKRVWSIDFSQADPARLLSGGDDGHVKLWSIQQEASTATIDLRANVCTVQFSPTSPHLFAAGAANYRIFLYDLRNTARALHVLPGHTRAVSYVRFLSPSQLVSASTDNTLRLWQLDRPDTDGQPRCVQVFRGHVNERNFTGLSVSQDGYISCGSENNRVFCYHRSMPMPVASYDFNFGNGGGGGPGDEPAHALHRGGAGGGEGLGEGGAGGGGPHGGATGGADRVTGPGGVLGVLGAGGRGPVASEAHTLGSGEPGGAGGAETGGSGAGQFVSSVCWSRRSNLLLAANSVGFIKLFTLN